MRDKPESVILDNVLVFKKWLADNYSANQIENYIYDDAGYPEWVEIESDLTKLFKEDKINELTEDETNGLIFLIARNWDVGTILNWFNTNDGKSISQIGMKESQFIYLFPFAVQSDEKYAKNQFASIIPLLKSISKEEAYKMLLELVSDNDEYVKRCCFSSLLKLDYPDLETLIVSSWNLNKDEFFMRGCLYYLNELNSKKLDGFIKEAREYSNFEFLQKFIDEIDNEE